MRFSPVCISWITNWAKGLIEDSRVLNRGLVSVLVKAFLEVENSAILSSLTLVVSEVTTGKN